MSQRRYYRRAYVNPVAPAGRGSANPSSSRRKKPLNLPEWDDTQRDHNAYKLTPQQLERRRQERQSKNRLHIDAEAARLELEAFATAPRPHAQHSWRYATDDDSDSGDEYAAAAAAAAAEGCGHAPYQLAEGTSWPGSPAGSDGFAANPMYERPASASGRQGVAPPYAQEQQHPPAQPSPGRASWAQAAPQQGSPARHPTTGAAQQQPTAWASTMQLLEQQVVLLTSQLDEERHVSQQLRAEFSDYVTATQEVISRLQEQMEQLVEAESAPPPAGGAAAQAADRLIGALTGTRLPQVAAWAGVPAGAGTSGDAGSRREAGASASPGGWQPHGSPAPRLGVASPSRSVAWRSTAEHTMQALQAPAQAAVVADEAALPSFAEMRRRSAAGASVRRSIEGLRSSRPASPLRRSPMHGALRATPMQHSPPPPRVDVLHPWQRPVPLPLASGRDQSPGRSPVKPGWWTNAQVAPSFSYADRAAGEAWFEGPASRRYAADVAAEQDVGGVVEQGAARAATGRVYSPAGGFSGQPLGARYVHPAEAAKTLSLDARVAAALKGRPLSTSAVALAAPAGLVV